MDTSNSKEQPEISKQILQHNNQTANFSMLAALAYNSVNRQASQHYIVEKQHRLSLLMVSLVKRGDVITVRATSEGDQDFLKHLLENGAVSSTTKGPAPYLQLSGVASYPINISPATRLMTMYPTAMFF